jgi:hypothetical protein
MATFDSSRRSSRRTVDPERTRWIGNRVSVADLRNASERRCARLVTVIEPWREVDRLPTPSARETSSRAHCRDGGGEAVRDLAVRPSSNSNTAARATAGVACMRPPHGAPCRPRE